MPPTPRGPQGTRFGDIAVTLGYLSREQAERAFKLQQEDRRYRGWLIGDIMVAEGMITLAQQERIAEVQKELKQRLDQIDDSSSLSAEDVAKMVREINDRIEKRSRPEAENGERPQEGHAPPSNIEGTTTSTPQNIDLQIEPINLNSAARPANLRTTSGDVDFLMAESAASSLRAAEGEASPVVERPFYA